MPWPGHEPGTEQQPFEKAPPLVKTTVDKLHGLMRSKLFAHLDNTALRQVLDAAQFRHFPPKTDIIVDGKRPNHLFLLERGRARAYILTESGSEILLLWAVPGVVLGLVSLLPDPPAHKVNATTVTE